METGLTVWTFKTKKRPGGRREGVWWRAYSRTTVKDLRRRFREETVAGQLLEMVEDFGDEEQDEGGQRVIFVKLRYPDADDERYLADVCLTEVGIGLIERTTEEMER